MGNAEPKTNDTSESFLDELAPGTELLQGQYKIVKFLNSGGFGITYLASDSLDRKVVIKECFPSSFCNRSRTIVQARSRAHTAELRSVVQLFVQEARSLAKLNHPNIVGVHQVFEDNETAYMVLDFVEGRDLLDTLEDPEHGLTPPQIKGILKDVLGAVDFIHNQDILHRDISPDNILLDADMRPVLIDFGAAREEATKKSRVLSAMRVVKDGYSPQEFYIQGSEQTPSSDLYALGASFYHLIAGEIPPNSQARLAAIASGEVDPYQPLVNRVNGYDSRFLGAIDKALGILPKDRMQSAEDWLDAMESRRAKSRAITQQVPMSSAAAASQQPEKGRGLVPLLGSVAVVAILAVGGLAFSGKLSSFGEETPTAEVTAPAASVTAPITSVATPVETAAAVEEEIAEIAAVDDVVPAEETAPVEDVAPIAEAAPVVAELEVVAPVDIADAPAALEETAVAQGAEESIVAETPAPVEAPVVAEDSAVADALAEVAAAMAAIEEPVIEEPVVAEAPVVPDAPQPEVFDTPEVLDFAAETAPAPEVVATVETTFVPRPVPATVQPEISARDDITNLAEAAQDIAAPAPAPIVVAEVAPEVEAAPVAEPSLLTTGMQFGLPFEGVTGSNVIARAGDVAPIWVRPGVSILAVNGVEIDRIADIDTVAADLTADDTIETMQLSFTVQAENGGAVSEEDWIVPVSHITSLSDGTAFETQLINGEWQTKVIAAPNNRGELEVGDVIVAFVSTSEPIKDHIALRALLERELEAGTSQFNFAVTREGSMWVVAMTYAEGA